MPEKTGQDIGQLTDQLQQAQKDSERLQGELQGLTDGLHGVGDAADEAKRKMAALSDVQLGRPLEFRAREQREALQESVRNMRNFIAALKARREELSHEYQLMLWAENPVEADRLGVEFDEQKLRRLGEARRLLGEAIDEWSGKLAEASGQLRVLDEAIQGLEQTRGERVLEEGTEEWAAREGSPWQR